MIFSGFFSATGGKGIAGPIIVNGFNVNNFLHEQSILFLFLSASLVKQ